MVARFKKGFTVYEALASILVFSTIVTLSINSLISMNKNKFKVTTEAYYMEFVERCYLSFNEQPVKFIYWLEKNEDVRCIQKEPNYILYYHKDIKITIAYQETRKHLIIEKKGCKTYEWERSLTI